MFMQRRRCRGALMFEASGPRATQQTQTLRTRSSTAWWPAWSPCEKLKRATFMPASMSDARPSSDQHEGPSVQKILTFGSRRVGCAGAAVDMPM